MKTFMIAALSIAVLGVLGAVWFADDATPVVLEPEPLITESPFHYPLDLWDQGVEGEAGLMVHVDPAGAVDSVYVLRPSGEPAFDSAAVAGARTIRFRPGRRDEEPVAAWVRLPVRFHLPDANEATPADGQPDE